MIKVTLGEVKPQEKPFPKLMTCKDGVIYYMIREGYGLPLHNWDEDLWQRFDSLKAQNWDKVEFTDYNDPITIQNA